MFKIKTRNSKSTACGGSTDNGTLDAGRLKEETGIMTLEDCDKHPHLKKNMTQKKCSEIIKR